MYNGEKLQLNQEEEEKKEESKEPVVSQVLSEVLFGESEINGFAYGGEDQKVIALKMKEVNTMLEAIVKAYEALSSVSKVDG